jgi:hypothetical protein
MGRQMPFADLCVKKKMVKKWKYFQEHGTLTGKKDKGPPKGPSKKGAGVNFLQRKNRKR